MDANAMSDDFNARLRKKIMSTFEQEAKERELAEQQRQIEADRQAIEHQKQVTEAAERAARETEERMKYEAERKASAEAAVAKAAEEQAIADQKALDKKKSYVAFLKKNGYTKETKADFHVARIANGNVALFKKVDEFSEAA